VGIPGPGVPRLRRSRAAKPDLSPDRPAGQFGDKSALSKIVLLTACAALYLLCRHAYYVGFFNDDAFYIIGARSLLHGRYAELNAPGAPPLVNYMPAFSLLLAPVAALAGGALWPFQLASWSLLLAGLWLFGGLAEEFFPQAPLAALALAALTPLSVSMSGTVLSDVPLLTGAMLALALARRAWSSDSARAWAAPALVAGFCALLRPSGAAVSLALAAALAVERRWKPAALVCAAAAAFVLPFLLRNRLLTGQPLMYFVELSAPYAGASRWAALRVTAFGNLAYYLKFAFETMLLRWPVDSAWLTAATIGASVVAVGYGLAEAGWRGWRKAPALFLAVFATVHLVWAKQAGRYLLPVLPLLFAYWLRGLSALAGRLGAGRGAPLAAAALALALMAAPDGRVAKASLRRDSDVTRPPERTLSWVRGSTPPDAVFAVSLDGRFYLLTGRRAVHLRRLPPGEDFHGWLKASGASFVALFPDDYALTTARGDAFDDPLPAGALVARLSDPKLYRLAFADAGERSAVFAVK